MADAVQPPGAEQDAWPLAPRAERRLLLGAAILSIGLLALLAIQPPRVLVRYVSDDAFYYFQVAWHLAAGHGPTFDGLTWTTGFHPLYALLLAGGRQLLHMDRHGLVAMAMALNTLCFGLTGLWLYQAALRLWSRRTARWTALLWFTNPHAILLAATGMEGSLYAACLAALFLMAVRITESTPSASRRPWWDAVWLGVLAGLCVLARSDALVFVAVLGLVLLWITPGQPTGRLARTAVFGLIALAPLAVWTWYCWSRTGQALQGSADMKVLMRQMKTAGFSPGRQVLFTAHLFVTWVIKSLAKVPVLKYVLLAGLLRRVAKQPAAGPAIMRPLLVALCVALALLGVAYALFLPRIWTWYYAPSLAVLTLLATGGLRALFTYVAAARVSPLMVRLFAVMLLLTAAESAGYLALKGALGRNRRQTEALEVAHWMARNLPPAAKVAAWNAGIYAWYSERPTVNLDGLINNDIAPLTRSGTPLSAYLQRLGIQYVVDEADYLPRKCPEWTTNDYSVIYYHRGVDGRDKAVWHLHPSAP